MLARPAAVAVAGALALFACTSGDDASTTTATPTTATTLVTSSSAAPSTTAAPTTTVADDAPPLEVALVWHMHQPRYPVVDGVVTRPWVRLHAAKDYLDMAQLAAQFPDLR